MHRTLSLTICLVLYFSVSFSQENNPADTNLRIFEKVDIEANFPGGEQTWRKYLENNLNPSVPADNGAPCGLYTVYVQFIVNKQGGISDIKPLTKMGYGMEQEVVRIISKSGLWAPAMQNGKPVNAYRKQPVTFMIEADGFEIRSTTPYVLFVKKDNELTIVVDKVKAENLEAIISQGTIINNGDGRFTARVNKPGRVIITVYNKKKDNKELGKASFEVRDTNASSAAQ
jgi:GldM C-terminal domain/Gram-negative bacterial TonB protein C-terminal